MTVATANSIFCREELFRHKSPGENLSVKNRISEFVVPHFIAAPRGRKIGACRAARILYTVNQSAPSGGEGENVTLTWA